MQNTNDELIFKGDEFSQKYEQIDEEILVEVNRVSQLEFSIALLEYSKNNPMLKEHLQKYLNDKKILEPEIFLEQFKEKMQKESTYNDEKINKYIDNLFI